jgi:MFS family permease
VEPQRVKEVRRASVASERVRSWITTTLTAFRVVPGYAAFWLSRGCGEIGWSASVIAMAWTALQVSDSSLAVGATFAARLFPALLFGIPFGAFADRLDRRRALMVVNALAAAVLVGLAIRAGAGQLGLADLLIGSAILGTADTMRGTLAQTYAVDLAGRAGATNAIALSNLGAMSFGAVGAAAGGIVLDRFGASATFLLAAGGVVLAALILLIAGATRQSAASRHQRTLDMRTSMTLLARSRPVLLIAIIVILGEVLGFSSLTVIPAFARDVLHVDAAGFGAISAARSIGGVLSAIALAATVRQHDGVLMVAVTALFGLAFVVFAITPVFVLSVALSVLIGAAAAGLDTLGQTLIQRNVEDHERGAAMGIWFFSIGFGPLGHLGLGAAASILGPAVALGVSGGLLVAATAGIAVRTDARRLR